MWLTVLLGFCPDAGMGATTFVVRSGESIVTAINQALPGDIVEIRSNETFHERLAFQDVQPNITVRAGIGFNPILQGDSSTDWTSNVPPGQDNVFTFINTQVTFMDLHLRLDLTDLEVELLTEGFQILKIAGAGEFRFTNCTFELAGHILDLRVVGRNLIRLENASATIFDNCDFRYKTNVVPWPTFNNTVGYFQPANDTLSVEFLGCRFDAVTDLSGQARSIGAGGGAGGSTILEITDCEFGLHRLDSRQFQQAYISPAVSGTQTTVRGCVFPAGANRYFGLEPGLTIEAERCLFMNPHIESRGGEIYLPDPGGNTIVSTNCVFLFLARLGVPFRGANDGEGRQYEFHNCTFNDLSGDRAESFGFDPALLEVTPLSPVQTFRSCIFNVPGFSQHLLVNVQAPGQGVIVNASDNLIHSKVFPLTQGIIPSATFSVREDALLNPNDGFHLLPGSPAIDKVTAPGTLEDFDGRARPIGGSRDIGAHEFNGAEITRPSRKIHVPTDAATIASATAQATRNFDEIVIDSDGPFFETMRGERYQSHVTLRAGSGFEPMIVVDADTDFLDTQDGLELASMSEIGTPFLLTRTGRFEGLHWRLDLSDMSAIVPPAGLDENDVSTRLLVLRSDDAEITFNDCTFELFGNALAGAESVHGLRPTVLAEGGLGCTFNNCNWVYDMDLIAWPGFSSAGIGYAIPGNETLEIELNDCSFEAVPDTAGRARHVGVSAITEGSPGHVALEINRCRFGENRADYDEPGNPPVNRQRQQAHVVVAGTTTQASINDSVFLDGAGRQLGLGNNLDVHLRRCILEPTTVGHALFPDPDGGRIHMANSVIRFDSHSYSDPDTDAPIRGEGRFGERVYTFVHCLFQDVHGVDGNPNVGLMIIDVLTGQDGPTRLENCIVDMPAATRALFDSNNPPNENPVIPVIPPGGSGNLINTGVLSDGIFPARARIHQAEPNWHSDGADRHHLSECSLFAIDRVPSPVLMDVQLDIDGDPRPLHEGVAGDDSEAHFDIGPDEFTGVPESEEFCGIRVDPVFRRGDHDLSGIVDITDAINILKFLFLGDFPPKCLDASDADNSGRVDLSDALNLVAFLFQGTVVIPPPGVEVCGPDPKVPLPAGDGLPEQPALSLGCDEYPPCELP